jgi:hypothetical protein
MADDDVPLAALASRGPAKEKKLDGNANLASLAKAKARLPKADDNTPLTALAKAGAAPQKRLSGVAKPKAKAGAKRKGSSSSDSSYYSYSSSEGGKKKPKKAGAKGGAKKKAAPKPKKAALAKKKTSDGDLGGDDADNKVKKKVRSTKEDIVAQLLSRWWFSAPYVAEDWPPVEESFYLKEMEKVKYRLVTCEEWEWVPEEDEQGRRKVYSLSQFRGLFRNSTGDLVDLRPKDTCPSLNNFMKKDLQTLCHMLISAYENQVKELKTSKYNEEQLLKNISASLTKVRDVASRAG